MEIEGETADGGGQIVIVMGRKKIGEWCTTGGVVGWSKKGKNQDWGQR
jgi:hypothetical protein